MSIFRIGWYIIYTKPRHEKKVHSQLTEMKLNSFLPIRKTLRSWHDRKRYVDEPIFPSYIFIRLNNIAAFYQSLNAGGALHYVRFGNEIARVSDSVIDNVMMLSKHANDVEVATHQFEPGRKLVVSQGALTGLSCEVVRYNNKQMLLVRVDLLKRNLLVTIPEQHLMPA